jgi:hypothetical protein
MLAGITSPYVLGASSLNHSRKLAAYVTSALASQRALPLSHVIRWAKSSAFSRIKLYQFRRRRARARAVVLRNDVNSVSAAQIARSVSALENSGQVPMTLSVAGSKGRVIRLAVLLRDFVSYYKRQRSFLTEHLPIPH